jgi:predicted nuclease of predicted toxin-antitoxin system
MRFLLDMNLPPATAEWMRSDGHDAILRDRLRAALVEAAEALQAGAIVLVEDARIRIRRPPND